MQTVVRGNTRTTRYVQLVQSCRKNNVKLKDASDENGEVEGELSRDVIKWN